MLVPRCVVFDVRMKRLVRAIDKFRCTGKFLDQFLIRDRGCITCGGVPAGILAAESVSIEPWLPALAYLLLLRPGAILYGLLPPHRRHHQQTIHVGRGVPSGRFNSGEEHTFSSFGQRIQTPPISRLARRRVAGPATGPAPAAGGAAGYLLGLVGLLLLSPL